MEKPAHVGPALLTWLLLALVGCKSLETGAREAFADDRSCPIERVTARERKDLSAYDLIFGKSEPPDDLAGDPERLALWQKKQDENRKAWDRSSDLFEVAGCGERKIYKCSRGKRGPSCSRVADLAGEGGAVDDGAKKKKKTK